MKLPERLCERSFAEWNYMVRGILEVWEMARLLGLERVLEELLLQDTEGTFAEEMARFGNDSLSAGAHLGRMRNVAAPEECQVLCSLLHGAYGPPAAIPAPGSGEAWSAPTGLQPSPVPVWEVRRRSGNGGRTSLPGNAENESDAPAVGIGPLGGGSSLRA